MPGVMKSVRTMGRLVDRRRSRTAAGALLELSAMANEKELLHRELARWERRHVEITARLAEIQEKQARLMPMTACLGDAPPPVVATHVRGGFDEIASKLKVQEFTY